MVRALRGARGLSSRVFGSGCGCSHTAILKIEAGEFIPTDDLCDAVSRYTGAAAHLLREAAAAARRERTAARAAVLRPYRLIL